MDTLSGELQNIDHYVVVGRLNRFLGRLSEAERWYQKALTINSRDYVVYTDLGILYDEMEQFDEADKMLRIATQLEPREAQGFEALIELYKMHYPGRADELDNIYRAASDYTGSAAIWASYARFLEDRREYRQAWIYWQEVANAEPENEEAAAHVRRLAELLGVEE